jgi:aminoglycoside phosphotransferase (APT) family kinase protein
MEGGALAPGLIDRPRAVRGGEELDAGPLAAYLERAVPHLAGPVVIEQFPSGFSNLTYLIRAGDHELVLRRPPIGVNIKSAHDMRREYRILSALIHVYPKVPRPIIYCEDPSVLGAPFYVMERVQGVILRSSLPAGVTLGPEEMRSLSEAFIDNLADLHSVDFAAAGLGDLGRPEGYVERQIRGWTTRYQNARTDDLPSVERVAAWLEEHRPLDSPAALIHNDYKYDNVVLDPQDLSRIIAVLDWEMATIGDPLMDVGTTLGYWVDPDDPEAWREAGITALTPQPGNLTRAQLVERYARRTGRDLSGAVFYYYYAYGLFKIAVIVQQIYMRYKKGLSRDPRFAGLLSAVAACGEAAMLAIEKRRIDRLAG